MFDKHVYSPLAGSALHIQLRDVGVNTLVITGGETDICVLATMPYAIDWGFCPRSSDGCLVQFSRRDA